MKYLIILIFLLSFSTAHADLGTSVTAAWKLDDSSGNATDSTGNGITLTNNGTIVYSGAAGKINNGVTLNGSSQWFSRATFSQSNPFTINMWVYEATRVSNADPANTHLLFYSDASFCEIASNNGVLYFAGNGGAWTSTGYTLPLTTYTMITVVNTASSLTIYADGSQVYTTGSDFLVAPTGNFYIGAWSTGSKGWFDGRMDEITIWGQALSSTDITTLYNSGTGLQYPFTVASVVQQIRRIMNYGFIKLNNGRMTIYGK